MLMYAIILYFVNIKVNISLRLYKNLNFQPFWHSTNQQPVAVSLTYYWLFSLFCLRSAFNKRHDLRVRAITFYNSFHQFFLPHLIICFRPNDIESAVIITEDGQFPLRQTNKNDICHKKRSNGPMIDYTKMGGAHV